ncbi:hypothetical protein MMC31_006296 [Peltigera leucophlebia]|nr:hypothetical protein [Peltigera leucophlebia]
MDGNIHFAKDHPNRKSKIQRPLTSGSCTPLIALMRPLSTNETAEDAVQGGHPETDARQNDLGMVLLALSIPWDQLPDKFRTYNATISSFRELCWGIWEESSKNLDEYLIFYAESILQMRKSQIESKLDQDLRRAVKDQAIETEFLERDGSDDNESDGERDIDSEDTDDLGLPNTQSYMHAVELTLSSWREADAIDSLEFSVLSHVQHALCIADNQGSSNNDFRYNMDLFGTGSSNCSDLGVRTDIDDPTTTTWKEIQKIALSGAQVDDDEVDENQDHPRISPTATTQSNQPDILEPVIANFTTQNQYLESVEPLSPSSNCRIVCDHIHAKFPLNYLQRLHWQTVRQGPNGLGLARGPQGSRGRLAPSPPAHGPKKLH